MFLDVGTEAIHLRDVQSQVRTDAWWSMGPVNCDWMRMTFIFPCIMTFLFHLLMQDELENYSFKSIYRCDAINTEKHFSSLLLLICQSADQTKPDIHFFNCETVKVSNHTGVSFPSVLSGSVCPFWIVSPVQVLQVMPLPVTYSCRQSRSVTTSHMQFRILPKAGLRSSLTPSGTVNVMVTNSTACGKQVRSLLCVYMLEFVLCQKIIKDNKIIKEIQWNKKGSQIIRERAEQKDTNNSL